MAVNDAAKDAVKAAFAADPLRLVQALGLRVDDRASKPPVLLWVFDGNETKASLQIGGRPGTDGLCTRYGAGDEKPFDCFSLVQRYRPQTDFRAALTFVASIYGIDTSTEQEMQRVKRWDVREADGTVIARHCRRYPTTGPRDRWWEPPEGGKGGLQGRAPKTLPLYGLPELLQQPAGTPVVIAEGEKAADAVRAAGLVAVGTYGTSCNPTDEVLSPLLGYLPILWPDADVSGSGERHMQHIADRLAAMGAEQILRADWPDAPDTGDAADTTSEHICQLVAAAQPWERRDATPEPEQIEQPSQQPAARDDMRWTDAGALAQSVSDIQWLWQDWLPLGFMTILAAPAGDGKSAIALDIAGRVLRGADHWPDDQRPAPTDYPAPTAPALVLDAEGCQAIWVSRIKAWGLPEAHLWFPGNGFARVMLDDDEALAGIRGTIAQTGARLVVIDSLRAALPAGTDENDSAIGSILAPWSDLARDTGIALLVVHHFGKASKGEKAASLDRLRGSSAIAATARVVWGVDRPQSATRDEDPAMRLSVVKNNLGPFPRPLGFVVGERGVEWCDAPTLEVDRNAPSRGNARAFLTSELHRGPRPVGELLDTASAQGISKDALYRARKAMHLVDVTDETDPQRRRKLWSLPAPSERDSSGWG